MKRNLREFSGHFHNNGFLKCRAHGNFSFRMIIVHDDENDDEAEEWQKN